MQKKQEGLIDIGFWYELIRDHWFVVMGCAMIGLIAAFAVNKISTPEYKIGASLLVIENQPNFTQESAVFMQGLGLFQGVTRFENEIIIFKSSPLIREALKNLNYGISYYQKKPLKFIEQYKTSPFVVIYNYNQPQPVDLKFNIKILDNHTFEISAKGKEVNLYNFTTDNTINIIPELEIRETAKFGADLVSEYYNFKIMLNENYAPDELFNKRYAFVFRSISSQVTFYQEHLKIEPNDLESTVGLISIKSKTPQQDIDLINALISSYLSMNLNKKIHTSVKTTEYIDNQLNIISDSLKTAEDNLQRFRTSNQVMDITLKTGRIYDQMQELEAEKAIQMVKYKYYQYINDYFANNKEIAELIAPSAMGIEDPLLNNLIQELITLNSERTTLIENKQEKSPYLKQLDIRKSNLINTISENIKYIINTTEISLEDMNTRIDKLNFEVNKLPKTERELFGFERKFNLNDAIYTFLLERRAEAQIAKASYLPDADIIEPAEIEGDKPIAPKKIQNYMLGLLAGFFFPLLFYRVKDMVNTTIKDKKELESMISLPILGQIFSNTRKTDQVVHAFPKSHIAESFRMIRNNLNYFLDNEKTSSIILVTSSFAQEGKSFILFNLATSMAMVNNKTIILGFDLRKPKLNDILNLKNDIGIVSFLSNQAAIQDIIIPTHIENLDVMPSGPVPPNPSELIVSEKMNELFLYLSERYKYIFIDSPPVGIISDALPLMAKADVNIFVTRQNYTPKAELPSLINSLKEKKFRHLCVVLNDVPVIKETKYGYKYYTN